MMVFGSGGKRCDEQAEEHPGLVFGAALDREVIILCVRWHLRFKLSFRDLVELMAEGGVSLTHTTILRSDLHYAAELARR
jgi:transposase-like protein